MNINQCTCGGKPRLESKKESGDSTIRVRCEKCQKTGPSVTCESHDGYEFAVETAVERWNNRGKKISRRKI